MIKNSLAEQVEQYERSKIEGSFVDFERMPILKNALRGSVLSADRLRMGMEILSAIRALGGTLTKEELKKLEEYPPEVLW
jgi:hypothetical protein